MKHLFSYGRVLPVFFAAAALNLTAQTTVPLLSDGQKKYICMPRVQRIQYFADPQKRQEMKKNGFFPLTFKIDSKDIKVIVFSEVNGKNIRSKTTKTGKLNVTVPAYVLVEEENGKISFGNLKTDQKYQWKCNNGKGGTIKTEDMTPRLMKIKGVPNVRDLGGYRTMDGKRTRQGLIYRTAGLNDNAERKKIMLSQEKLNADNGYLAKLKAELELKIARNKALLKGRVREIKLVPYSLQNTWTVFLPEHKMKNKDLRSIRAMKTIPETLLGAKALKMKADVDGLMTFPKARLNKPAVFCQIFESPEEGIMQIGTGADYFYAVYINGETCLDLLNGGDGKSKCTADNHVINIRVKKGKNIIVIPMRSGSATWSLAVNKPSKAVPYKTILKQEIKSAELQLRQNFMVYSGEWKKGRNRLDKATQTYLTKDLGIRSDIDLRSDGECLGMTGSPAGKEVVWFHYSSSAYGGMQGNTGKTAFRKVFKVFLDEKNYPIVFHCIAGQDRTGAVAFIINALLGIPEEKLFLDWEVTGFWNGSSAFNHASRFNHLYEGFKKFPGKTINERVENYVLSLGFTKKDITKLRNIMIETELVRKETK